MATIIDIVDEPTLTLDDLYLELSDFFDPDILNEMTFIESKVKVGSVEKIDHSKRKTKQLNKVFFISDLPDEFYNFIENNNLNFDDSGWKFLKYEKDDFFVKHVDEVGLYTVLIFPSSEFVNDLEGGELVIGETVYKPNTFDCFKIIIFPINTYHEVKPITRGTRYVFKTCLHGTFIPKELPVQNNMVHFENHISDIGPTYNSNLDSDIIFDGGWNHNGDY